MLALRQSSSAPLSLVMSGKASPVLMSVKRSPNLNPLYEAVPCEYASSVSCDPATPDGTLCMR